MGKNEHEEKVLQMEKLNKKAHIDLISWHRYGTISNN